MDLTRVAVSEPQYLGSEVNGLVPLPRVRVCGKRFSRAAAPFRIQGVTYGPFALNSAGDPFPSVEQVGQDLVQMRTAGINAIRTYHLPPDYLFRLADENAVQIFVDVPWPKHLCFLDSAQARADARAQVEKAAKRGLKHSSVFAYSIGNEIPPDIVRWHGARNVEKFLAELYDVAKQSDPDALVTYANYPPTEYLDLSFLDFATFNVYLHDQAAFRNYLVRLQNLVGDRPLVMGELGMDTLRQGEMAQAEFLRTHLSEVALLGLAGAFTFSWTDEWHTGGHAIQDWAFGVTYADRMPKPAFHALRETFEASPAELLSATPRVSVVVCTYNGASTLEQCLNSLVNIDYPDYEVIVVDDGSTDHTREILTRFPTVKAIHQQNRGLSVARNVGLRASSGAIIAFTDSDCYADPHWLTHLVDQFNHTGAAAVGGPNLTPEDGWLAACVAAAPGQPTHVLESDQVAEHIPGCNMAFRREALEAINGFDSQYRKAGDDVDVCWRLQQAGYWITFAPGAFVWHHRRQGPRAYFKQQAGYGEAEALLRFKHPDRFNGWGDGKWRGVLYGPSLQGIRLDEAIIYRGTFSTGLFQCIYQPAPAHWATVPNTLEWHLLAVILAATGVFWPVMWLVAGAMLGLSAILAAVQAYQARIAPQHDGPWSRILVAALCYAQPLVRSFYRYRTRFLQYRQPVADPAFRKDTSKHLSLFGTRSMAYWTDEGIDRTELLGLVIAYFNERGWGKTLDSGWETWDLEVYCHPWTVLQVSTAQEELGGRKRVIRLRYSLRLAGSTKGISALTIASGVTALLLLSWPMAFATGLLLLVASFLWCWGTYRAAEAVTVIDSMAGRLRLISCDPSVPAPHQEPDAGASPQGGPQL